MLYPVLFVLWHQLELRLLVLCSQLQLHLCAARVLHVLELLHAVVLRVEQLLHAHVLHQLPRWLGRVLPLRLLTDDANIAGPVDEVFGPGTGSTAVRTLPGVEPSPG